MAGLKRVDVQTLLRDRGGKLESKTPSNNTMQVLQLLREEILELLFSLSEMVESVLKDAFVIKLSSL